VNGLSDAQIDNALSRRRLDGAPACAPHLDSHANSYIRFKLALTEDWPTIKPYDEAAWARLADSRGPIDGSLTLIDGLHGRWVAAAGIHAEEDFQKGFVHPERGRQKLGTTLALYDWHSRHHTAHITGCARGRAGRNRVAAEEAQTPARLAQMIEEYLAEHPAAALLEDGAFCLTCARHATR